MKDYLCHACKFDLSGDVCYFSWAGEPFGRRSHVVKLCSYCGYLLKPTVTADNIAIVGTYAGDIYTYKEMVVEGFNDKHRLVRSIKGVGKVLGMTEKDIAKRLKG